MPKSDRNSETDVTLSLSLEQKQILEKAATITGLTLNDYVRHQVLSAAILQIASYDRVVHDDRDRDSQIASQEKLADDNEASAIVEEAREYTKEIALENQNARSPLSEDSKHLHDLAKAMMVSLAWSYADALRKEKTDPGSQTE